MQRAGLGDDDTPGSQPGGGAPVSGQSCSPPCRSAWERCWRSAAPRSPGGRPLQLPEVQGRTWADEGADLPKLPAPAAHGWDGPLTRALPYLGSPHQQRNDSAR